MHVNKDHAEYEDIYVKKVFTWFFSILVKNKSV